MIDAARVELEPSPPQVRSHDLHRPVLQWYAESARDLPWRRTDASPWAVLVSEIMLQQTPVARVLPVWNEWMTRWPTPEALAAEPSGAAVRAWGRLGYPRRALRLHSCATVIVNDHGGQVPDQEWQLLNLPGVGAYTAAAVAAFAFGRRAVVVDTNVRRVLARSISGVAMPSPSLTRAETIQAQQALPAAEPDSVQWNVAVMELGALICTARSPGCERCPIQDRCAWVRANRPAYQGRPHRSQAWHGTDRQCRGAILHLLREHDVPVAHGDIAAVWPRDTDQLDRCLAALVSEGLIQHSRDKTRSPRPSNELGHGDWYGFAPG